MATKKRNKRVVNEQSLKDALQEYKSIDEVAAKAHLNILDVAMLCRVGARIMFYDALNEGSEDEEFKELLLNTSLRGCALYEMVFHNMCEIDAHISAALWLKQQKIEFDDNMDMEQA